MGFVEEVSGWVARQRWLAGKSHAPRFRILDSHPAPGATRYLLMDDAGTPPTLYQVPLAPASEPPADPAVIVSADDAGRTLVDAPH